MSEMELLIFGPEKVMRLIYISLTPTIIKMEISINKPKTHPESVSRDTGV